MSNVIGEDRSSFQPVTPWTSDAFGFAKATEGTGWSDPTFRANWANLKAEKKVRGAYHFFHPADDPQAQANYFVNTVKTSGGFGSGDVFVADVEILFGADSTESYGTARAAHRTHEGLKAAPQGMSPMAVGPIALQFLDEVSSLVGPHCPVLIYTDLYLAQNFLGMCSGFPLWIAYYNSTPPGNVTPWKSWFFWQSGATGAGGGDLDYFHGDEAQLLAWDASYAGNNWTETLVNNLPTLQLGAKDVAGKPFMVHRLQNEVAGYGRWNGLPAAAAVKDDGDFGPVTETGLKAVQAHAKLRVDGIAGQATWTALIA